jgi:hypothetical protein
MPATVANLWPPDFGQEEKLAPVAVLRQQGTALGERTQNIIVGRVFTTGNSAGFRHQFVLYCPPLGYQIEIFAVEHSLDFYPVRIVQHGQEALTAADPDDFAKKLGQVFSSEPVKKIVRSLLAQSKQ